MDLDFGVQWQFEPIHFQHTPSRDLDNLSALKEIQERNDGIHFMLRCGNALKLKSNVLSCAAAYFHRFYMRHSIGPHGYDKMYTAITCLFLASKVEESTRKLKDVAQICYLKKYINADSNNTKEVDKWQDRIQSFEPIVLEALCFDLSISHPHECLAEAFGGGLRDAHRWEWKGRLAHLAMIPRGLYQLAWSIVNDSLRIPLCLFYRPNLIASAAYLIAYTVISTSQEGAEGSEDAIQQICEGGGLTPTSSSERHATPPPHEHGRDATLSLVANGAGISKPPTTTVNVGSNQSSNEMNMAVNETSGENTLDNVPTSSVPLCIDLDTLLSTPVAGPWVQAFAIEETELQNLTDVVGNLLELYHNIENTGGISRISLSRKYDSLGGTSQPSPPSRPIATSNSSPALTLTSNATPVHGPQEDSSQDYTLSAPRPEDTEAIAVEADVSQS